MSLIKEFEVDLTLKKIEKGKYHLTFPSQNIDQILEVKDKDELYSKTYDLVSKSLSDILEAEAEALVFEYKLRGEG